MGRVTTPHIFLVTYPAHGHVNPLIQLARNLAGSSFLVTFISTDHAIQPLIHYTNSIPNLHFESFSLETADAKKYESSIEAYFAQFRLISSRFLSNLILLHNPTCIIYDFGMPWVLEIAKPFNILCASFFTQSCAVYAIYFLHYHRLDSSKTLFELGNLAIDDIPSPLQHTNKFPSLTPLLLDRFSNSGEADLVLVNSFDELESEAIQFMLSCRPLKTIGPFLPTEHLHNQTPDSNSEGEGSAEDRVTQWLARKERGSVVYVSFGSILGLCDEQMEELAWGLKESRRNFLWVVKNPNENLQNQGKNRLPEEFVQWIASEQGLVVPWCSQLGVLSHHSVGCFVSHCGWNSTLESVSLGVPMVAIPQWMDQLTNAKFVADVWGVGVRASADGRGVVSREEVVRCVGVVMGDGESGRELRESAARWRDKAREANGRGGTSWRNFERLLSQIRGHASTVRASNE